MEDLIVVGVIAACEGEGLGEVDGDALDATEGEVDDEGEAEGDGETEGEKLLPTDGETDGEIDTEGLVLGD